MDVQLRDLLCKNEMNMEPEQIYGQEKWKCRQSLYLQVNGETSESITILWELKVHIEVLRHFCLGN